MSIPNHEDITVMPVEGLLCSKNICLLLGVMPPDEYHCTVDNSVYTNAVAQRR